MAATLTIRIRDGKAVVIADGSKRSCDAARAVERAIGKTTKSVPTGTKTPEAAIQQK